MNLNRIKKVVNSEYLGAHMYLKKKDKIRRQHEMGAFMKYTDTYKDRTNLKRLTKT